MTLVLVLPEGMGTRKLVEDNNFLEALKDIADSAEQLFEKI